VKRLLAAAALAAVFLASGAQAAPQGVEALSLTTLK